ncbi:MAG: carboxypeptidase regulatory-like domain-containing protein, partial [Acidobacteriaceae bacterium]
STEADVARIEASPNGLSVIENFFVKNASSPPRTQFGPRAYEIYLPKEAQVVAAAAQGPGSMPVQTPPTPLGTPGDYAFVYPLRPGETRFQVSYQMPYSGSFQFHPRVGGPVDNLAIILPKSVQFAGTPVGAFQPIDEDVKVQTYLARNVTPESKLAFTVSGTGLLPQESATGPDNGNGTPAAGADQGAMGPEATAQSAAANNTRPGIGLGVPIDTPDPLHKYKWWILSLAAVLLAVGAAFLMKQNQPVAVTAGGFAVPLANIPSPTKPIEGFRPPLAAGVVRATSAESHRSRLMEALKEELFALETERLEGRIAPEEYDKQKGALEVVLVRALQSGKAKNPAEAL